jgi:hypothetical protein
VSPQRDIDTAEMYVGSDDAEKNVPNTPFSKMAAAHQQTSLWYSRSQSRVAGLLCKPSS